jgi:ethanolamine utilization protein EutN
MKLGKVKGRVVSTKKIPELEGERLLLVQPVDEKYNDIGIPLVATDKVRANEGNTIFFESGKEAGQTLDNWFNPVDASIIGIVDDTNITGV